MLPKSEGEADTHIYTQTRRLGVCVCVWNGVRRESEAGEVREWGGVRLKGCQGGRHVLATFSD